MELAAKAVMEAPVEKTIPKDGSDSISITDEDLLFLDTSLAPISAVPSVTNSGESHQLTLSTVKGVVRAF